jgi:hypothetical protein
MALTAQFTDIVANLGVNGFSGGNRARAAEINTNVLEPLLYLKTRNMTAISDWDGTVASTSSTTFVDITGATANITIPTTGGRIKITVFVEFTPSVNNPYIAVLLDGANISHSSNGIMPQNTPNQYTHMAGAVILTASQTAGSHTVKLQYKIDTGSFVVVGYSLLIEEV